MLSDFSNAIKFGELSFMFAVLPVRQFFGRIKGKHKKDILCTLCGSACPMKSMLNLFHRGGEKSFYFQ
jgi:hypothetical protein